MTRVRWASVAWQAAAFLVFAASFLAIVVVAARAGGDRTVEVTLVLAAGSRLSMFVSDAVGKAELFRGIWLDVSRRMAWLEDYAKAIDGRAERPAPARLAEGIRFEEVTFRYPGLEEAVLDRVSFELPAGRVIAVVGENGAGKSTLIKLLCGFYTPSEGRITVDGTDLGRIDTASWRQRLAGAFQDFFRFEYPLRQAVGLGDLARADDDAAVEAALARAGAEGMPTELAGGLDTQLGPTWAGGTDLSHGQWQKIALARGLMRDDPLLLMLDEPTSALDAEVEHALFERFAEAAHSREGVASGGITVLVSHRFSTVRMADLIIVLSGSQVAEYGSHEELMARDGTYAELYGIQAASYRAGYQGVESS
jgi:ATP-binding cassette subfamily B protein